MRFEGREKRIQRGGTDYERIYQNVSIFFFSKARWRGWKGQSACSDNARYVWTACDSDLKRPAVCPEVGAQVGPTYFVFKAYLLVFIFLLRQLVLLASIISLHPLLYPALKAERAFQDWTRPQLNKMMQRFKIQGNKSESWINLLLLFVLYLFISLAHWIHEIFSFESSNTPSVQ